MKQKLYELNWKDKYGNIIASKRYHFYHIKEARYHAKLLFADCRQNDVAKITACLVY